MAFPEFSREQAEIVCYRALGNVECHFGCSKGINLLNTTKVKKIAIATPGSLLMEKEQ